MRAIRWLTATGIMTIACYFVYTLAWRPFRCNIVKKRLQSVAFEIFELPNVPTVTLKARHAIAELQPCVAVCPTDVDMYMTLAAHDRVLGRLQHAADMYHQALSYDRRPELFFNLGMVQLQLNQRDAALIALTQACSFSIEYAGDIPDPDLREEVLQAVRAQQVEYTKRAREE
jgi:tetratricopeptide (TPR) repeat protein